MIRMKREKLRILLADDHQMLRDGLQLLIDARPDMCVVGQAADGQEALRKAHELSPDIVVMDISMPGLNGLQATQQLKAQMPAIRVLALTAHEDESYLAQLCKAGASGYVLKRSAGDELLHALTTVAGGGLHFEPSLAAKALARQVSAVSAAPGAGPDVLSQREREVLIQVASGFSNKEIAAELRLSIKTIETYKVRIAEKLGLRSRAEIVQFALRHGWLNARQQPSPS
jgi:DNA-binding NarL/FixJ family response regulator